MNYQLRPKEELIDRWKTLMALEIVRQIKGRGSIAKTDAGEISIPKIDLLSDLSVPLGLLKQEAKPKAKIDNITDLVREKKRLEEFCHNILIKNEIQIKLDSSRLSKRELVKSIIDIDNKEHRPPEAIVRVERLMLRFSALKQQAENKVREKRLVQKDAWEKYDRESSKGGNLQILYNLVIKRLEAKVEEEYYQMAVVQLYTEFICLCKMRQDWAKASLGVLSTMQTSLERSCVQLLDRLNFGISEVDVVEQQKLLEVWIGHPAIYWGNAFISPQQIEGKLLENLAKPAHQLGEKFCTQLTEEVEIESLTAKK